MEKHPVSAKEQFPLLPTESEDAMLVLEEVKRTRNTLGLVYFALVSLVGLGPTQCAQERTRGLVKRSFTSTSSKKKNLS